MRAGIARSPRQTRVRSAGVTTSFPDLCDALMAAPVAPAAPGAPGALDGEWRVHYHVPLNWPGGEGLTCVRGGIDRAFFDAACASGTTHFEVEIYTLSVFPGAKQDSQAIFARELQTVLALYQD